MVLVPAVTAEAQGTLGKEVEVIITVCWCHQDVLARIH